MTRVLRNSASAALAIVFLMFILFGLPDGVFGTVWPTQRADLGLAIGDLSWVITGFTIGGTTGSVLSGHITSRWGTSSGIIVALSTSFFGLIGFGLAPNLGALVLISIVAGGGAGLLDPIVNAWVSLRHSARVMGFLHAFFGLGAAMGPPLATTALGAGITWRTVFITLGILELGMIALVWSRRAEFDRHELSVQDRPSSSVGPMASRLLILTMAWFFLVVGLEVSVSAWAFSLLFEQRGIDETVAALWVAGFWATFTAGRVLLGVVGDRMRLEATLAVSIAIVTAGAALMWTNPAQLPAGVSLPILGAGISLLFPVMVLLTPRWLGPNRAAVATGYQFGAASVGAVAFSLLIGGLADARSLEVLGPVLLTLAVATGVLLVAMKQAAPRAKAQP